MAIAWTTIENALYAWVASAVPGAVVDWSQQNAPRGVAPTIVLRLRSPRKIGQDWLDVVTVTGSPPAGQEIEFKSRGHRTIVLSMQCFAAEATGSMAAVMVLDAVRSAVNLPSIRDSLTAAGVGIGPFEAVLSMDGFIGDGAFEPRASMDVLLMLASEVSEFSTYIEMVEVENETTGDVFEVPG